VSSAEVQVSAFEKALKARGMYSCMSSLEEEPLCRDFWNAALAEADQRVGSLQHLMSEPCTCEGCRMLRVALAEIAALRESK
jgi:hypothetical protein